VSASTRSAGGAPDWPGGFNLADLGGLPLAAGGATRFGRLFRSGRPEYLTTEGWRRAHASGVSTVIDLRNPPEVERTVDDPEIDESVLSLFDRRNTPTEDPDDPEFRQLCGPWVDHPRSYAVNLRLYLEKLGEVFRSVAGADGAVLVHCSAGRDRTGMVIALLLRLCGVTSEAIADDYAAAARRFNAALGARPGLTAHAAHSSEVMSQRLAERRADLIGWIADLDVAGYLRDSGLTAAEVDSLRAFLA
jgi:protein-tyrosine phosphatase